MTLDVSFRPAMAADAPAILALVKHLGEVEHRPEAVTISLDDMRDLIAKSDSPATTTVMVDGASKIVGYAMTARKFSSFKGYLIHYIEDIVISPNLQGAGFGRLFMAELARLAADAGAKKLEWSAEDVNSRALEFYRHLGIDQEAGRVHFFVDEDGISRLAGRILS